jgi:chromate transporter
VVLARRGIVDMWTALLAVAVLAALLKFRRVPEPVLIVTAGIAGLALKAAQG